jgi:hypothetical protein
VSAFCRPSARNQADPMVGCGVQQTRETLCGVNRRSREERQGRNALERWHSRAPVRREWTHRVSTTEGRSLRESHERSPEATAVRRSGTWAA